MEKIISDWSTNVKMTGDEAKDICKLGQGEKCCAFLVVGNTGFECVRLDYPNNSIIFQRLEQKTFVARGEGGWKDCVWEGEL